MVKLKVADELESCVDEEHLVDGQMDGSTKRKVASLPISESFSLQDEVLAPEKASMEDLSMLKLAIK